MRGILLSVPLTLAKKKNMAAQKRMFDRAIIETDNFLDLPDSGKALYFLLGVEADDEGFVSTKRVMRLYQIAEDNLKILMAKNFVIPFESGVVVITGWHKNNWLDSRRIKPTEYKDEKQKLLLTESKEYVLSKRLASASLEESSIEENSIEQNSIEKINAPTKGAYGELGSVKLTSEEHQKLQERFGEENTNVLIFELDTYIASKGKKYKSHYATLLNWAKRKFTEQQSKGFNTGRV